METIKRNTKVAIEQKHDDKNSNLTDKSVLVKTRGY